jgi:hypothetical protein
MKYGLANSPDVCTEGGALLRTSRSIGSGDAGNAQQ